MKNIIYTTTPSGVSDLKCFGREQNLLTFCCFNSIVFLISNECLFWFQKKSHSTIVFGEIVFIFRFLFQNRFCRVWWCSLTLHHHTWSHWYTGRHALKNKKIVKNVKIDVSDTLFFKDRLKEKDIKFHIKCKYFQKSRLDWTF